MKINFQFRYFLFTEKVNTFTELLVLLFCFQSSLLLSIVDVKVAFFLPVPFLLSVGEGRLYFFGES